VSTKKTHHWCFFYDHKKACHTGDIVATGMPCHKPPKTDHDKKSLTYGIVYITIYPMTESKKSAVIKTVRRNVKLRLAQLGHSMESLCREALPGAPLRGDARRHPAAGRIRAALSQGNPRLDILEFMSRLLGCTVSQLTDENWNGQV
jgi:hypothetical protein